MLKQFQVLTSPERLAQYGVTLEELTQAVEKSNAVTGGGFLTSGGEESLIRIVGRAITLEDLENTVVKQGEPVSRHGAPGGGRPLRRAPGTR